jgi:hypothetical protein
LKTSAAFIFLEPFARRVVFTIPARARRAYWLSTTDSIALWIETGTLEKKS